MGSAVALIISALIGILQLDGLERVTVVIAALVYIFGVQLPTFKINVPLNNRLQSLDAEAMDEEALGYSVGSVVRDKDGISGAVLFADLVAHCRGRGSTVWARLDELYRRHGLWLSAQECILRTGTAGAEEIAVVVRKEGQLVGIAADRLLGRKQVVVKPAGRHLPGLRSFSGLTILGDGTVAPILNVGGLLRQRLDRRALALFRFA